MNSEILLLAKNRLNKYIKDKEILDVILFGSSVKGKSFPEDIDAVLISKKEIKAEVSGFHIIVLSPEDFFINPPSIVNTLLREGYSLKNKKPFSENYKFHAKILFVYGLKGMSLSNKVKIVNILRGKVNDNGMVKEYGGEWLANQVFIMPVENENIFEKFFLNFKVKFMKSYLLMH